jgi:hypothetical protein
MVREILDVLQVSAWVGIDIVIAAVAYVVVDRLGVAPVVQRLLPGKGVATPSELDEKVLNYCNEESEDFAVEACLNRARDLTAQGYDGFAVLSSLQQEDGA